MTIAQIYTEESMRNRSIMDALDGRAYVTFDMAVIFAHKHASMTDPSLAWAEHAFRTRWCVRATHTHPSFKSA